MRGVRQADVRGGEAGRCEGCEARRQAEGGREGVSEGSAEGQAGAGVG